MYIVKIERGLGLNKALYTEMIFSWRRWRERGLEVNRDLFSELTKSRKT